MDKKRILEEYGNVVRKYRQLNGFSQEQLGEFTDLGKNTIGRIERGETDTHLSTMYSISLSVNTKCHTMIKEAESQMFAEAQALPYDVRRLFVYCQHLTQEQIISLCHVARNYAEANESKNFPKNP
ncbi:MAG: helix-turn-helix domain-containing protein [Eubacterium sp.]|nr:helix-turn-helix domain-containing protein [Eubacterium sp.]